MRAQGGNCRTVTCSGVQEEVRATVKRFEAQERRYVGQQG